MACALFFETALLTPVALAYLASLYTRRAGSFDGAHRDLSLLLISTGVVTGLPLVWFGHAARYLRLTTIGFLQYLAPSGTFILGVFVYHETFTRAHLVTFAFIWVGLAIFTFETVRLWRSKRLSAEEPPPIAD